MLIDRTNEPLMRLLVNATRQASVTGPALAAAHRAVGNALTSSVADHLQLREVEIEHVTGKSMGVEIQGGKEPIIIALLRGGLFVAEGIWERLPSATLHLHHGDVSQLARLPVPGRPVVVVDSVINSGASMCKVLDVLKDLPTGGLMVATIVGYRPTVQSLASQYGAIDFIAGRLSERSFVGSGATDTGARLFGTTNWPAENQRKS